MPAKRILIVDDEPIVTCAIKITLQSEGYAMDLAASGSEALAKYQPGKYGLVLTDNMMPGMTGAQLATQIKLLSPAQHIILLSGSPPFDPTPAFDLVVLKPFSVVELRSAVARLLRAAPQPEPEPGKF